MNLNKENNVTNSVTNSIDNDLVSFIKRTYQYFAASMLVGAVGAYIGIGSLEFVLQYFWPIFIVEIIAVISLSFIKQEGIKAIVLFIFTLLTGLTSAPLIASTIAMEGGTAIVGNAFAMTSFIVAGMSFFAVKTERDFTNFTTPLIIALVIIIVFSLINVFIFQSPIMSVLISAVAVLLFTMFVVHDTQKIIRGQYRSPIDGAVALYLDFINIFMSLLNIMRGGR